MGKDLKGKELGEGIIQKSNGRYEARFVDRFGKRVSVSGKNLKDVKNRFNQAILDDKNKVNVKEKLTLNRWYELWMSAYKFDAIRRSTRKNYNTTYRKHIQPVLGNRELTQITQLDIRMLLKDLKKKEQKL